MSTTQAVQVLMYPRRINGYGGGGVFFLVCEDFGRMFDKSFPAGAFFFFFKWRLALTN